LPKLPALPKVEIGKAKSIAKAIAADARGWKQ
jgi:hypothetical protein